MNFRLATIDDLPAIIRLIADDFLGRQRENFAEPLHKNYVKAFLEIDADSNNELIVAEAGDGVIATLQLTYTPSLSFQGGKRCTVESVRVDEQFRGQGIGRKLMLWAIERAKEKGCVSMQLTTHNERKKAHKFYEDLGFKGSHLGMKLALR